MNFSVWRDFGEMPEFQPLRGNADTQVLIIGGGMCGLLCAKFLQELGEDYILVEAETLGGGITKNTTAKITSQQGLHYHQLLQKGGIQRAQAHLEANQWALKSFRQLCGDINCDFQEKNAFCYSLTNRKRIENEVEAVNRLGLPAKFVENLPLPFRIQGAIEFENQAQFHPLKFMAGISQGLNIFEHTPIRETGDQWATTDSGKITAKKIIVATHFPFINKHGLYFMKMYQHRSYVIALENAPKFEGMYIDEAQNGMSFRNYEDLLFVGGGDHRTGKNGGNWAELRDFAKKYYPVAREKYSWATQDCMSLDGLPYIGNYSKSTPDLYVATGFNKWGMTGAMLAAEILSRRVTGGESRFDQLFSPQRKMLRPQLLANAGQAGLGLLTPGGKRCPHLGCALKWNKAERSWDCPCHGSRFEENGGLVDNPATGDLS